MNYAEYDDIDYVYEIRQTYTREKRHAKETYWLPTKSFYNTYMMTCITQNTMISITYQKLRWYGLRINYVSWPIITIILYVYTSDVFDNT